MASTTFTDGVTPVVSSWLNDVNTTTYTTVPSLSTTVTTNTADILTKAAKGVNTDITSLASPELGAATATTQSPGNSTTKVATTAFVTGAISSITLPRQIQSISASVAANALTLSSSPLALDFRSTTLGDGAVTLVTGSPANLIVPSSATLGTENGIQSNLILLALNNAGTIELAIVNLSGGVDISETGLISTTAISAASSSATVVYSTTARTNVAYRVIGLIRSTQATAGTWATSPSLIQGAGGEALTTLQAIGYGQTWQNVTRTSGVTYYNTTGKPITLNVIMNQAGGGTCTVVIAGVTVANTTLLPGNSVISMSWTIPINASYSITDSGTSHTTQELR